MRATPLPAQQRDSQRTGKSNTWPSETERSVGWGDTLSVAEWRGACRAARQEGGWGWASGHVRYPRPAYGGKETIQDVRICRPASR